MVEIISPFLGLVGVIVGGLISYKVQAEHQKKVEVSKDNRSKHIAYNQFLLNEGESSPLERPMHHNQPKAFDPERYKVQRELLYNNLHLMDKRIIHNVLKIDMVSKRAEVMGPEQSDTDEAFDCYTQLKDIIIADYEKDLKN